MTTPAQATRPVVRHGSLPPSPSLRSRALALKANPDVRRLVSCLLGGLVLAVMTGPEGTNSDAMFAVRGSLANVRVIYFLAIGLALWAVITTRERFGEHIEAFTGKFSVLPAALIPKRNVRYGSYLAGLAIAVILPLYLSSYWQEVLVDQIGVYVLLAVGLNVVVGYAGLLDLGYVAFYAIGAYATAYWTGALPVQPPFHLNPFFVIPFAIAAAMLAGVILGTPTLRLRGDYLAIVTLGFGEIAQIVAQNLTSVTGGAQGVIGIPHPSVHIGPVRYTWLVAQLPYYYLLLGFVVIVLLAFHSLENSRVGRFWTAIREDEVAARSSGIHVVKYKVMAFAIGASTSGFAGLLTATKIGYIGPEEFTVQFSIQILVLVIFGGMGSLVGAVVGAAFLQWAPQFLRVHPLFGYNQQDTLMYFGAVLIVMMIFRPAGIVPSRRRRREFSLAESGVGSADAMEAGLVDRGPVP